MTMAALSPMYPAPSEARAKRSGGRGFYRDRNLPYAERKIQRTPNSEQELGHELAMLADRFPQFRHSLNQLRNHVLVQMKPRSWKYQRVFRCLGVEPLSVEEIMEETTRLADPRYRYESAGVERASVQEILQSLRAEGKVEQCNHDGGKLSVRRNGRPAGRVYWRLVTEKC